MYLSKEKDKLDKALESLTWDERRAIGEKLISSFLKGECKPEEFFKRYGELKNSCPPQDLEKMYNQWMEKDRDLKQEMINDAFRQGTLRLYFEGMAYELLLNMQIYLIGGDPNEFLQRHYKEVKTVLCENLKAFGLTKEQEEELWSKPNLNNYALVIDLVNQEPK